VAMIMTAAGSERSAAAIPSLTNITPKAVIMITAVATAMALPERDLNTCILEVFHGQGRFRANGKLKANYSGQRTIS
jgi:hypothetical protein